MLYVLYGQDRFSIHRTMLNIKARLGDGEMLATNTTTLDGRNLTLSQLKNHCDAVPFLSAHRLVIVNGLLGRFETVEKRTQSSRGRPQSGPGEWEGFADYVSHMPPTTVLVLIDGDTKAQNPLLKQVSSLAEVSTFPALRGKELKAWIRQLVSEEGGTITQDAVDLLSELIGGDLWAMHGEIQKLTLYCQARNIGADDVRHLTTHAQEANMFALVDAVADGKTELAQRVLHRLYNDGAEPMHILAMITRQFRLIALATDLKPGLSRPQIQERLGLRSSYPVDKTLRQARAYDLSRVKRAYRKLLETDLAIKTGKYGERLALELMVTELARPES